MNKLTILTTVALLLSGWGAIAGVRPPLSEVVEDICSGGTFSSSAVGLLAVTSGGDTLVAVNPELKLVPASNVKLITTGLALKYLGTDYRYETRIGYTGNVSDGVLSGDLYIIGGGDPTTGSRTMVAEPSDALFGRWLSLLEGAGIRRIEGRVVADPRFFDSSTPENLAWSYDDLGTNYGVGPTGLNFFENAQNFLITPGRNPGDKPAVVPKYPETPWMKYSVSAVTGERGTANTVFYVNTPLAALGEFGGSFPCDRKGYTYEGSNRFGAYTCAWHFMRYLEDSGLEVCGGCADISSRGMLRTSPGFGDSGEPAAAAGDLSILGSTFSSNLSSIVAETNHESNNFFAETLLKTIARKAGYPCSADGGVDAEEKLLASMGLQCKGRCRLVDGSGLARKNYVSAGFFVDFLARMMEESCFDTYLKSLPVPGSRGTLEYKFPDESQQMRGRIHMKSGSMNGILCYSGYILPSCADGETIVFSLLTNNVTASVWSVAPLVDKIISALAAEN